MPKQTCETLTRSLPLCPSLSSFVLFISPFQSVRRHLHLAMVLKHFKTGWPSLQMTESEEKYLHNYLGVATEFGLQPSQRDVGSRMLECRSPSPSLPPKNKSSHFNWHCAKWSCGGMMLLN